MALFEGMPQKIAKGQNHDDLCDDILILRPSSDHIRRLRTSLASGPTTNPNHSYDESSLIKWHKQTQEKGLHYRCDEKCLVGHKCRKKKPSALLIYEAMMGGYWATN